MTAQCPHFRTEGIAGDFTAFDTHLLFHGRVLSLLHLDIEGGWCNNRNFTELHGLFLLVKAGFFVGIAQIRRGWSRRKPAFSFLWLSGLNAAFTFATISA
jgi:hypothetical protein